MRCRRSRASGPKTILKIFDVASNKILDELKLFLQSGERLAIPAPYECRIKEFFKK